MASRNFLIEGLDPTVLSCITTADLLQMIREATPSADLGFVIQSETTPNTTTYPELARFLWLKPSTGDLYRYTGTSWELVLAQADIATHSITMSMLKPDEIGALPRQVPQINAAGTEYVLKSPNDLFNNNELNYNKLSSTTEGHSLIYIGGAWITRHFSTEVGLIVGDNQLPAEHIYDIDSHAATNQVLSFATPGGVASFSYVESLLRDNTTPIKKLAFSTTTLTASNNQITVDGYSAPTFYHKITADVLVNVALHEGATVTLALEQATGSTFYDVTYDAAIKWSTGTTPIMTQVDSEIDVVTFVNIKGTIYASAVQAFPKT